MNNAICVMDACTIKWKMFHEEDGKYILSSNYYDKTYISASDIIGEW